MIDATYTTDYIDTIPRELTVFVFPHSESFSVKVLHRVEGYQCAEGVARCKKYSITWPMTETVSAHQQFTSLSGATHCMLCSAARAFTVVLTTITATETKENNKRLEGMLMSPLSIVK